MKINLKSIFKARRISAARLLLMLILLLFAGLWLFPGVEYALSFQKDERIIFAVPPLHDVSPSPIPGDRLHLNTATIEDFQTLPGIGPKIAQAIWDYRQEMGPFHFPEELMDVPGIGQKRYDALKDLITCTP